MHCRGIHRTSLTWIVSLVCLATLAHAASLGTAFTYQGQLKKSGVRVTDTCSFQFTLWDDPRTCPAGGNPVGPALCFAPAPSAQCGVPVGPPITVTEGLFTVQLDFGVNAFEGSARWLQMSVQCPGDMGLTPLCPRQELTPAPYSLYSAAPWRTRDSNVYYSNGLVGIGTSMPGPDQLDIRGSGVYDGSIRLENTQASSGAWRIQSNGGVDELVFCSLTDAQCHMHLKQGGNIGMGTSSPTAKLEVRGEQSGGDSAVVSVRNSNGDSLFFVRDEGRASIGRNPGTPDFSVQSAQGLVVTSQGDTELNIVGSETAGNTGVGSIIFHNTHSSELKKRVASIVASVAGLNGAHLDFNTEDGSFTNDPPRMRIASDGNVGIGGVTNPETVLDLHKGPLNTLTPGLHMLRLDHPGVAEYAAGIDDGVFLLEWTGGNPGVTAKFGATDGYLGLAINSSGNVGIGTITPSDKLTVCGSIRASGSINANAGCDVAEAFDLSERERIEPGMVMVLDSDRLGHLRISTKAYDTKVAGIVSGAKGTKPGVLLGGGNSEPPHSCGAEHSRGVNAVAQNDDLPIALSGRVYALVDATKHAVKVGDLLTTSNTPGHAMRVTNFRKSQGAVLGKAMEPLEKGKKGLILVLVGLQ